MKWGIGVNIGWGTLSYPTLRSKVEGRGEVGVGVSIGWVILPYGVQVGY